MIRDGATDAELTALIRDTWAARGPIAGRSSGWPCPSAASCTRSRPCAPIRGARCTPAAAERRRRLSFVTRPTLPEHRDHGPARRADRAQIPPNTGNIARLCAATDAPLHLIEPLGFSVDDKEVKRAGLDYWDKVDLWLHPDWFAFRDAIARDRCLYFSANATRDLLKLPSRRTAC